MRPTEAQLRWAQFHHKRQAEQVRIRTQQLWQRPETVSDVSDALPEDGASSTSDSGVHMVDNDRTLGIEAPVPCREAQKPCISRGRRALLRVSRRRWRERKNRILKEGFRSGINDNDEEDDQASESSNDALAAIFAERSVWHKSRKRRRRRRQSTAQKAPHDSGRSRRFEEAFNAMMRNLAALRPDESYHDIVTPERVWTRPEHLPQMETIDGRDYTDLKWGIIKSLPKPNPNRNSSATSHHPLDRGASWLVHMPSSISKRDSYASRFASTPFISKSTWKNTSPEHSDEECLGEEDRRSQISDSLQQILRSPMQGKLSSIVAVLQQKLVNTATSEQTARPRTPPTMKLSPYLTVSTQTVGDASDYPKGAGSGGPKSLDVDFAHVELGADHVTDQKRMQGFQQLANPPPSSPSRKTIEAILQTLDPYLKEELESQEVGTCEHLLSRFLDEVGFDPDIDDVGEMEKTKAYLEIFARRFLVQARSFPKEPQQSSTKVQRSGGLVQRLVSLMEQDLALNRNTGLISADGKLHKPTFARLMLEYLEQIYSPSPTASFRPTMTRQRRSARETLLTAVTDTAYDCTSDLALVPSKNATAIVERLIKQIEIDASNMDDDTNDKSVLPKDGIFDTFAFEHIVTRYLAEATGTPEEVVLGAQDLQSLSQRVPIFPKASANLVERMVAAFEGIDINEKLTSDDGKLNTAFFESMMRKLLSNEVSKLSKGRRNAALDTAFSLKISGNYSQTGHDSQPKEMDVSGKYTLPSVEARLSSMTIKRSNGHIDKLVLRAMIARYLSAVCNLPENVVLEAESVHTEMDREFSVIDNSKNKEAGSLMISNDFAKRLVDQIKQSSEAEQLVLANGDLNKAVFEMLMARYLGQCIRREPEFFCAAESPLALAEARRHAGTRKYRQREGESEGGNHGTPMTSCITQSVIVAIERELETTPIVTAQGKVDFATLEILLAPTLSRALASNAGVTERRHFLSWLDSGTFVKNIVQVISNLSNEVDLTEINDVRTHELLRTTLVELYQENHPKNTSAYRNVVTHEATGVAIEKHAHEVAHDISKYLLNAGGNQMMTNSAGKLDVLVYEALLWRFIEEQESIGMGINTDNSTPTIILPKESESLDETSPKTESTTEDPVRTEHIGTRYGGSHPIVRGNVVSELIHDLPTIQKEITSNDTYPDDFDLLKSSANSGVGQFLQSLSKRVGEDTAKSRQHKIGAVAAFRKTREQRVAEDDKSSKSTFRILPDGIKRVVQKFRGASDLPQLYIDGDAGGKPTESASTDAASLSAHSRASDERSGVSQFLSENVKNLTSALIFDREAGGSVIDTDDASAQASDIGNDSKAIANLLLSPTLLTKRHQQAIRAIENRTWEQVEYLLSANPWLAEMTDLKTNQCLLHKLALFGAGEGRINKTTGEMVVIRYPSAPEVLNVDLVELFPSSVHKFDVDGNLPLHMAAASANIAMINLLGDRFPSGASVRNEDGMLPLHLAIQACASETGAANNGRISSLEIVRAVLDYFPAAVTVADNEGNLPIHTAARVMCGHNGARIVHLLFEEAERRSLNPSSAAPFRNKAQEKRTEMNPPESETSTLSATDASHNFDIVVHCNLVRNENGEVPLLVAVRAGAGWEVLESLVYGPGGDDAAQQQDDDGNTCLHYLVGSRFMDSAGALSMLKVAPDAASVTNRNGLLPIQLACQEMVPEEVILALALVDLPFELTNNQSAETRSGRSWWFLTCELDDRYVNVVERVVQICSYPQIRQLCFLEQQELEGPLISNAT
jgi:ankyrin repeat protein